MLIHGFASSTNGKFIKDHLTWTRSDLPFVRIINLSSYEFALSILKLLLGNSFWNFLYFWKPWSKAHALKKRYFYYNWKDDAIKPKYAPPAFCLYHATFVCWRCRRWDGHLLSPPLSAHYNMPCFQLAPVLDALFSPLLWNCLTVHFQTFM